LAGLGARKIAVPVPALRILKKEAFFNFAQISHLCSSYSPSVSYEIAISSKKEVGLARCMNTTNL
jgi:hypothetical protein